jgi:hypothetical protein
MSFALLNLNLGHTLQPHFARVSSHLPAPWSVSVRDHYKSVVSGVSAILVGKCAELMGTVLADVRILLKYALRA